MAIVDTTVGPPEEEAEPRSRTQTDEPGVTLGGQPLPRLPAFDEARFEVTGERARGGLGLVLEARDRLFDRGVALKQPQHPDRSPEVARFLREALITARLQHPAIVPIYDAGIRAGGEPCFAMRLVAGTNLREAIDKSSGLDGRLALLSHVQAVADAVAYAHGQGILHRDLKPSNVLVGPFGETVVIDWGLAKDLRDEVPPGDPLLAVSPGGGGLTRTGAVLGTPGYMAPEQRRGEELDERADVYAIGAMLFHLLTGAPADPSGAPSVAAREPAAPADLIAIVDKAMALRRDDRYPTAAALAEDLKRFATGQLVGARRYSTWALVIRGLRRHRATALVGLALVLALVAGVAAVLREQSRTAVENNRLRLMQAEAVLERDPTAAAGWLKTHRVSAGGEVEVVEVAARARAAGVARYVLTLPDDTPTRVCLADSGRWAGIIGRQGGLWLFDLEAGTRRRLGSLVGTPERCLFADGDGHLLAWGSRGGMTTARLPDGPTATLALPGGVATVWALPDARLLIVGKDGRIQLASLDGGPLRTLQNLPPGVDQNPMLGPQAMPAADRAWLHVRDRQGGLWRVPIDGGAPQLVDRLADPVTNTLVSADGRQMGLGTRQQVGLRDMATGETHWRRLASIGSQVLAVRPAGGGALFVDHEGAMRWWKPGSEDLITLGKNAFFKWIQVSRDGDRVAWVDLPGTLFVADLAAGRVRTLVGHHTAVRGLAMTPDGRWLASTHGSGVRIFSLAPATARRIDLKTQLESSALGKAIHALGARGEVLAPQGGRTLVAIDARTGRERTLGDAGKPINVVAASPGGRRAAAAAGGRVFTVELDTGRWHELSPVSEVCDRLSFVGDDALICLDGQADLHLWELPGGGHRILSRLSGIEHGGLEVAHDLRRVVVASALDIVFIDIGPDRLTRLGPVSGFVFKVAISRDGRRIAAGLGDGRLLLWQPDSASAEPRPLGRRGGFISGLLFLPDSEGLVVTDETGSVYQMDLRSGRGAEIGQHEARISDAQLSPAGRWLATSDSNGEVRLWEPTNSGVLVLRGEGVPRSIEFIGEDWLLTAGQDGRIEVQPIDPHAFVPASPAALSGWLDTLTTARIGPAGQPVSPIASR